MQDIKPLQINNPITTREEIITRLSDDEIFNKFMSSKENKHIFTKCLNGLPVEENTYVVDALKEKEVANQSKLWYYNRYKEKIPPNELPLTPQNMNLGLFTNKSPPM